MRPNAIPPYPITSCYLLSLAPPSTPHSIISLVLFSSLVTNSIIIIGIHPSHAIQSLLSISSIYHSFFPLSYHIELLYVRFLVDILVRCLYIPLASILSIALIIHISSFHVSSSLVTYLALSWSATPMPPLQKSLVIKLLSFN